jgi:CheY-like chemotaxis protein
METPGPFSLSYPLHILIADNHPKEHGATKDLLAGLGYRPESAASGAEVLEKTSAQKFDLILVDTRMPGLDQVLKAPFARSEAGPILIAIAAGGKTDFRETCVKAMADASITRPVKRAELLLQLKACSVLAGKCRIRQ